MSRHFQALVDTLHCGPRFGNPGGHRVTAARDLLPVDVDDLEQSNSLKVAILSKIFGAAGRDNRRTKYRSPTLEHDRIVCHRNDCRCRIRFTREIAECMA